jgi:hypothetical protein
MGRRKSKPSGEAVHTAARIKELEREVRWKDKARTGTAALLVLKKTPGDLGALGG